MPPKNSPSTPGPAKRKREAHTPIKLQFEEEDTRTIRPRSVEDLLPQRSSNTALPPHDELVFMVLDVTEDGNAGSYNIWGCTPEGTSVLTRVSDFQPYFYIALPRIWNPNANANKEDEEAIDAASQLLKQLRAYFNRGAQPGSQIQRIEAVKRRPIMYYRPDKPDGELYLRLWLSVGGNTRRTSASVQKAITSNALRAEYGWIWRDQTLYESEVSLLQRFLADVPISGGAWVYIPPSASSSPSTASHQPVKPPSGYSIVPDHQRVSTCSIEVTTPWTSIACLTPDATQLSDASWTPPLPKHITSAPLSPKTNQAVDAAKRGDIVGLCVLAMDVCAATRDGVVRTPVESDPIVAISCTPYSPHAATVDQKDDDDTAAEVAEDLAVDTEEEGLDEDGGGRGVTVDTSTAAVSGGPVSSRHDGLLKKKAVDTTARPVIFLLSPAAASTQLGEEAFEATSAATVLLFKSEAELLLTWEAYVNAYDPDIIAVYQVGTTLETIRQRFAALGLHGGGGVQISRLSANQPAKALQVKKVTQYSVAWVKSQSRMSSTSNQETFRADVEGRVIVDVLRQVLTNQNLGSYSLADAVQSLLGQTIEVLPAHQLTKLTRLGVPPELSSSQAYASPASPSTSASSESSVSSVAGDAMRVARYSQRRVDAVVSLLTRLATIPDYIELARAVGLTLGQVSYNAQMVRTWSLLLRVAGRVENHFICPTRPETSPLQEHTFILHPVEAGTVGLHKQPVAILDFASLYPSIFMAHNLCYTTLLHPEDTANFPSHTTTVTPTGAKFVNPSVRQGIIPDILRALVSARATTREQLKSETDPARRAVLDCRQKALKVTANACYGFTGAQASPLQCPPLADSCLAYGAQACRTAKQLIEQAAKEHRLTPAGEESRVIYGHTDSMFVLMPKARDVAAAIDAAKTAARVVSDTFDDPMELKFERVCQPFMLLHVNRYAGRAFTQQEDIDKGGELIVKGLKSMWRQAAPILRTTLHGALVRILMQDSVQSAVKFVESEVLRLLSGRVDMHELAMTGGLWRVTGDKVERAAEGTLEKGDEDPIRGPHAALAVRLQQQDPGRTFVLGERLQYVLLAGHKLQEDAACDTLEAAKFGKQPDYELYWKNKMQKPLQEVFATCLSPSQLQSLMNGPHTMVKVDHITPSESTSSKQQQQQQLGPASPSPAKGKGRQTGLTSFYRQTAKCLGCKRSLGSNTAGKLDTAPGLCDQCMQTDGKWQETYMTLLDEENIEGARQCEAFTACRQCDSGCSSQEVLCENSECPVTYARLSTQSRLKTVETALKRMDIF